MLSGSLKSLIYIQRSAFFAFRFFCFLKSMWLCGDSVRGPEDPLTDSVYCKLKDREQSASRNQIKIQRGGGGVGTPRRATLPLTQKHFQFTHNTEVEPIFTTTNFNLFNRELHRFFGVKWLTRCLLLRAEL